MSKWLVLGVLHLCQTNFSGLRWENSSWSEEEKKERKEKKKEEKKRKEERKEKMTSWSSLQQVRFFSYLVYLCLRSFNGHEA